MSSMIVTISGNTLEELRQNLRKAAIEFGVSATNVTLVPVAAQTVAANEAPASGKSEVPAPAKKRGRPKKNVEETELAEEPAIEAEAETETETEEESLGLTTAVSREQAMTALQGVNSKKGLPAARELLSKFGAQRFSELKEEDLAKFVKECQQVCA